MACKGLIASEIPSLPPHIAILIPNPIEVCRDCLHQSVRCLGILTTRHEIAGIGNGIGSDAFHKS